MSEPHVVIVANGGANIASLQYALERLNVTSLVSAEPQTIRAATHVILPGVGAAADAMMRLRRAHLHELLPTLRQPVLGICLGMQLLFEASDEGQTQCLGIIPGRATRFAEAPGRRVPHIGWNTVDTLRESALLAGLKADDYAYFVHSYALPVSRATVASTCYGAPFTACVEWGNFYGTQFHPERSAAVGARVLKNFLAIH
ncbi:MAG: imidazole glycerol phosphate synthase subunit HisH [Steroidobacteraceae bacterium]